MLYCYIVARIGSKCGLIRILNFLTATGKQIIEFVGIEVIVVTNIIGMYIVCSCLCMLIHSSSTGPVWPGGSRNMSWLHSNKKILSKMTATCPVIVIAKFYCACHRVQKINKIRLTSFDVYFHYFHQTFYLLYLWSANTLWKKINQKFWILTGSNLTTIKSYHHVNQVA